MVLLNLVSQPLLKYRHFTLLSASLVLVNLQMVGLLNHFLLFRPLQMIIKVLMNLEIWARLFLDGESYEDIAARLADREKAA